MEVSSYLDLVQYLVWSFPLIGALGILAWRVGGVVINKGTPEAHAIIPQNIVYIIYALLALIYIAHVIKTCQVNFPLLKAGVKEEDQYRWGSVAALNSTYFANFGAELAVVSMLPMFFQNVFSMTPTNAGLIAASFAFVNLFARPLGGAISDYMHSRKLTMLMYMLGIAVGFLAMAFIAKWGDDGALYPMFDGFWWIVVSVIITILCSIFVQGAEGATFAVIPMIKKSQTGQIAGMAGAYGNVGAVCYLVLYSLVDGKTFFFYIAFGAFISFLFCLFMLKEPEGAFADE